MNTSLFVMKAKVFSGKGVAAKIIQDYVGVFKSAFGIDVFPGTLNIIFDEEVDTSKWDFIAATISTRTVYGSISTILPFLAFSKMALHCKCLSSLSTRAATMTELSRTKFISLLPLASYFINHRTFPLFGYFL